MSAQAVRVNEYLTKVGDPLCDMCVQRALGISQSNQVALIAGALATTSEFSREKGLCASCQTQKTVSAKTH